MEEIVIQRVNEIIEEFGTNPNAFSKSIGVPGSTFNQQLNGKTGRGKGVKISVITAILNTYPEISAEWLLRGEGEMKRKNNANAIDDEKFRMNPNNNEDVVGLMSIVSRFLKNQEDYHAIMKDMVAIYERINNK